MIAERKFGYYLFQEAGNMGLLILSAFLFALSFPSFLSDWGWFPLGFIALIPAFIAIHRSSWKVIVFYGAFYAFLCYALFNYWLSSFHPFAILIVPTIYAAYFLVLFPLLKAADALFPKYGYFVQLCIWMGYEYLRTLGFLGYPYGNIGYSQYLFLPFIQISSIFGVWGVSAMTVFPSIFLGNGLKNGIPEFKQYLQTHKRVMMGYGILFTAVLGFGFITMRDYSEEKQWKTALIQHNADTWEGGLRAYTRNLRSLIQLSEEALKEDPDIVIWSETAFVPGIDWHSRFRTDQAMYELVREFKEFMADRSVPFVTGNSDGQLADPSLPPVLPDRTYNRDDYNATFLYHDGELKKIYRKTHLVPFTEHFPYEHVFPRFHRLLEENDYRWWEKGTEYTVFEANGVKFSTPICFEDVFGYISRRFIREGAQVIVNVSNDSWSGSVAAQMQHLGMAVFRTVENRRSMVRSTNSGMTCTIDPDGRIIDMLDPFVEGYLVSSVPIYTGRVTFYSRAGDWLPWVFILIGSAALAGKIGYFILGKKKQL